MTSAAVQRPGFDSSDSAMDQLVKLSRYFGSDPEFVIAGGGNTSVKIGDRLFVKGSGTSLATISAEGFVAMERKPLETLIQGEVPLDINQREAHFKQVIMNARVYPEKGQRPSVEAVLHHLLPRQFVIHSHSTLVNMITCCKYGKALTTELFDDKVLWIPYVDPGYLLAKTLYDAFREYQQKTGRDCPGAVFMQNHGLIICGDTPEDIFNDGRGDRHDSQSRAPSEPVSGGPQKDDRKRMRWLTRTGPPRGLLAVKDA